MNKCQQITIEQITKKESQIDLIYDDVPFILSL